jgi:hypothetical protein
LEAILLHSGCGEFRRKRATHLIEIQSFSQISTHYDFSIKEGISGSGNGGVTNTISMGYAAPNFVAGEIGKRGKTGFPETSFLPEKPANF